jgi:putative peptidoglycan lipid II flippase
LAVLLLWAAQYFPWLEMRSRSGQRAGLLALVLCASVVLYFGALWAAGLKLRQMLRR